MSEDSKDLKDELEYKVHSVVAKALDYQDELLASPFLALPFCFPDALLDFAVEVRDGLFGDFRVLLLRHLPGRLHHADEIFVTGKAH